MIHIYIYIYICIYIYIYTERDRERERERSYYVYMYTYTHIACKDGRGLLLLITGWATGPLRRRTCRTCDFAKIL